MRAAMGVIGLLLVVAIGYFIYGSRYSGQSGSSLPPKQQIDTVGIQNDLLSVAQAERLHFAAHGEYGSIADLHSRGFLTFASSNRRGYSFSTQFGVGNHFTVTAAPMVPEKAAGPTYEINETMQITSRR